MKASVLLLTGLVLVGGILAPLSAQTSWVVVPGQGWGPVALGMTDTQALAYFGPPMSIELVPTSTSTSKTVRFRTVTLWFNKIGDTFVLSIISIFSPSASRTSNGIGIGSSIHDVLQTYGDNLKTRVNEGQTFRGCMRTETTTWAGTKPDRITFSFAYLDQGVTFYFTDLYRDIPSVLKVDSIAVERTRSCPLY